MLAGLVGELGLLERAAVQRDGTRLIAADVRQPPVQPPQRREAARRHGFAEGVGRPAERRRGLLEIVLQQPGLGQHRPQSQLVVARQRGRSKDRRERFARPRRHGRARARRRRARAWTAAAKTTRGEYKATRGVHAAPNRRASAASVSWKTASCVSTRSSAAIACASSSCGTRYGERCGRARPRRSPGDRRARSRRSSPNDDVSTSSCRSRILVDRDRRVRM